MQPTSKDFPAKSSAALKDDALQKALGNVRGGFQVKRAAARQALPEFDAMRDAAVRMKTDVLRNLDGYLAEFENKVQQSGGNVHWAPTAEDARQAILQICKDAGAKTVTKGKSMIAEEIGLNEALEAADVTPIETDLGEYIIQLRQEPPSHIIAPAIHLSANQVEDSFRKAHPDLPEDRDLDSAAALVDEARQVLRQKYLDADVGITGSNFLVAETGSTLIVTNEGNGDLTQIFPRVHIVIASIDKVLPRLEDVSLVLRLLARSATGQEVTSYTTFSTGPKQTGDKDGPEEFHVVLLDNGRSKMLGTDFEEVLRCIRCGACMNHCPVYGAIGGHAYGWVYPGPIGAVLSPWLLGVEEAGHLPNASTFCGRCEAVCPMHIPLPKLMRKHREAEFRSGLTKTRSKWSLKAWSWLAQRPALYGAVTGLTGRILNAITPQGRAGWLPLAGGWTRSRDLPTPPQNGTFRSQWAKSGKSQT
ncbi:MAG: LutB/LldF family L-lactate oxidation iron-sulfur protein [Alphaproteobacteria bacterium]